MAHGWNATAYQILNPGIERWIAPGGGALVGFVRAPRRWVAAGEPVCAPDRTAEVAGQFERAAQAEGCRVCWFGADARLREALKRRRGHSEMLLGAQPVWDPARWPDILKGKASLRAQLNRARNKGVRARRWPSAEAHEHPALQGLLAAWLAGKGLPPMHFLVEPNTLGRLADRRVFVAEQPRPDGSQKPVAFLVASPVPARAGWLVEQLVRDPKAPNGTAAVLVDAGMRAAAASGAGYVTLGLAPLSAYAPSGPENPLWLRALLGWVRAHADRFYTFRGLDAFKAKFVPDRWDPVTALTNEPRPSPVTLYAIAEAFSGDRSAAGFVATALKDALAEEVRTGWGLLRRP